MNESIGDLNKILVGTDYEKSAECIKKVLSNAGIKTLGQLDNSPRRLGIRICGYSTWELIATVRERTLNPPPEPKPVAKKVTSKPVKKDIETKSAVEETTKEDKE